MYVDMFKRQECSHVSNIQYERQTYWMKKLNEIGNHPLQPEMESLKGAEAAKWHG